MSGRLLAVALLLAPLAATPAGARAQGAQRTVDPGGVATTVVTAPVDGAVDSADYVIEPVPGIRFFTTLEGRVAIRAGRAILPVTFGVPGSAPAAPFRAGTVRFRWPGGSAERDARVRVAARHGLELEAAAGGPYIVPGQSVPIRYVLRNTGNAVDTVTIRSSAQGPWRVGGLPTGQVLAAGDSLTGSVRVRLREEAPTAIEYFLLFTARGLAEEEVRARLRLISVQNLPGRGGLATLADLPSTIFVGASAGANGQTGVALRSSGAVGETAVDLELRLAPDGATPPAFQGEFAGPEARLELRRDAWTALAGDIFRAGNILLGSTLRGRGAELSWERDGREASVFAALPGTRAFSGGEGGHIVTGSYGTSAPLGEITFTAADIRRSIGSSGHRATGVEAMYQATPHPLHAVRAELAFLRLDSDSAGAETGPALDATYEYRAVDANASVRLRRVPATVAGRGGTGNELFFSGSLQPRRNLRVNGWGFIQSQPFLERAVDPVQRGAALSARTALGGIPVQLTGRIGETEDPNAVRAEVRTRSVELSVDWPLGPLTLESDVEVGGVRADGTDETLLRLRGGASWRGPRYSLWGSASLNRGRFDRDIVLLDLAGRGSFGEIDVDAGANAQLDESRPFADEVRFWSAVLFPVGPSTRLRAGVDYLPFSTDGSRWRFALGVSRQFDMPLPIQRPPVLRGVLFEDRDGDRERDDDEPGIPDVEMRFGFLIATTDADGRFRFLEDGRGAVHPDAQSLPLGMLLPDDVRIPRAGFAEIPLVRAAGIELTLFLDRDNDGVRDEIETPADRAVVRLIDAFGHTRAAVADARGNARFASLPPGRYSAEISPAPPAESRRPIVVEITVPPGELVTMTIAVPLRQREIRIGPNDH